MDCGYYASSTAVAADSPILDTGVYYIADYHSPLTLSLADLATAASNVADGSHTDACWPVNIDWTPDHEVSFTVGDTYVDADALCELAGIKQDDVVSEDDMNDVLEEVS